MGRKVNKATVSHAIISKIARERKPKEIRTAHIKGYKKPTKVILNSTEKSFTPDIEAVYENENVVYEIELNKKMPVEKWQSFSKYVRKKNGSFYLVVPQKLKEFIKKVLHEKEVNAGVITFATEPE
jgi:hypothetical protein